MEYEGIVVVDVGESFATTFGQSKAPAITTEELLSESEAFSLL